MTNRFFLLSIVALLLLAAGCKKENTDTSVRLAFTNLAIGSPGMVLQVDGNTLNALPTPYPQRMNTGATIYSKATAGMRSIYLFDYTNYLRTGLLLLDAGKSYSLFAIDSFVNGRVDMAVMEDDFATTTPDSAHIRVVSFSPDTLAIDVDMISIANDSFRFATNYTYVQIFGTEVYRKFFPKSANIWQFRAKRRGTQQLLTASSARLDPGKFYTFYIYGRRNSTSSPLGSAIQVHD